MSLIFTIIIYCIQICFFSFLYQAFLPLRCLFFYLFFLLLFSSFLSFPFFFNAILIFFISLFIHFSTYLLSILCLSTSFIHPLSFPFIPLSFSPLYYNSHLPFLPLILPLIHLAHPFKSPSLCLPPLVILSLSHLSLLLMPLFLVLFPLLQSSFPASLTCLPDLPP